VRQERNEKNPERRDPAVPDFYFFIFSFFYKKRAMKKIFFSDFFYNKNKEKKIFHFHGFTGFQAHSRFFPAPPPGSVAIGLRCRVRSVNP
jgi:hypothetical protein